MAISKALDALGPAAAGVQPVFITIDPERDTKVLAEYLAAFHPSFVGLTGSPEDIRKVANSYKAFYVEAAGRTQRRTFDRPCRRHLSDRPGRRVSRVHAAADRSRPLDRGLAQKSRQLMLGLSACAEPQRKASMDHRRLWSRGRKGSTGAAPWAAVYTAYALAG